MDAKTTVDMWTTLLDVKKREFMEDGMSEEDAEDKACREVREEIRRG